MPKNHQSSKDPLTGIHEVAISAWEFGLTMAEVAISTPSRLDLSASHAPRNARPARSRTCPHPSPLPEPLRSACRLRRSAESAPPQAASDALAPSATRERTRSRRPISLLTHDRYACELPTSPHPPDLGKPTSHHQLVHRVINFTPSGEQKFARDREQRGGSNEP